MKTNDKSLTLAQYAAQFNKGQGKTTGAETGKKIDLVDSNIPAIVAELGQGFKDFALSAALWKESNYGDLEGDRLEYIQNHWLGRNHFNSVDQPATEVTKNPLERANKVLSADEYRSNAIKLNLSELDVSEFDAILSVDGAASTTKDKLLVIIRDLQTKLFTEEQAGTYAVMLEKEEQEAAKFKSLLAAGFKDIAPITGGYSAIVSAIGLTVPIPTTLGANGYVLTGSEYNPLTMELTVNFKEQAEQPEPIKQI